MTARKPDHRDRCCGRRATPQLMPRTQADCQHDYVLVRVDTATGEIAHVPALNSVALALLEVHRDEWKPGVPAAYAADTP